MHVEQDETSSPRNGVGAKMRKFQFETLFRLFRVFRVFRVFRARTLSLRYLHI
jgi:hypothetical protein